MISPIDLNCHKVFHFLPVAFMLIALLTCILLHAVLSTCFTHTDALSSLDILFYPLSGWRNEVTSK